MGSGVLLQWPEGRRELPGEPLQLASSATRCLLGCGCREAVGLQSVCPPPGGAQPRSDYTRP